MRRKLTALFLGLVFAFSLFATHQGSAKAGSVWGVYTDRDEFYKAVNSVPATKRPQFSEQDREKRRRQVSEALTNAKTQKEMERVANRFGLVIYQPATATALSDGTSIQTISAPTMTWDSFDMEYEFSGYVQWSSKSAISSDVGFCFAYPCQVGGVDAISLVFSNWPASAAITSYYTSGHNSIGGKTWYDSTSDWQDANGTKKAVTVSDQDYWDLNSQSSPDYNWWFTRISFWVSDWDTSVHGLAQVVYSHTWSSTGITGADFSLNGGSDYKVTAGLVIHFTSVNNRWAKQGADLKY